MYISCSEKNRVDSIVHTPQARTTRSKKKVKTPVVTLQEPVTKPTSANTRKTAKPKFVPPPALEMGNEKQAVGKSGHWFVCVWKGVVGNELTEYWLNQIIVLLGVCFYLIYICNSQSFFSLSFICIVCSFNTFKTDSFSVCWVTLFYP